MAGPIGKGDWVERVPDTGSGGKEIEAWVRAEIGEIPQIGKIYQVRDVRVMQGDGYTWDALRLVGIVLVCPSSRDAWAQVSAFRPIYRPKQEIIEALKAPVTRTPQVVKLIWDEAKS